MKTCQNISFFLIVNLIEKRTENPDIKEKAIFYDYSYPRNYNIMCMFIFVPHTSNLFQSCFLAYAYMKR